MNEAFQQAAMTAARTLPLAFVRQDPCWHIEVYRNANGTARVVRHEGIGCQPLVWDSQDRSPEEWVAIQEDGGRYVEHPVMKNGAR